MNHCLFQYVSSEDLPPLLRRNANRGISVSSIPRQQLNACNEILAEIKFSFPVPGIKVDFSGNGPRSQLNGLFFHEVERGVLDGKDYRAIEHVFRSSLHFWTFVLVMRRVSISLDTCRICRPDISLHTSCTSIKIGNVSAGGCLPFEILCHESI